jgi:hypothetical protein
MKKNRPKGLKYTPKNTNVEKLRIYLSKKESND